MSSSQNKTEKSRRTVMSVWSLYNLQDTDKEMSVKDSHSDEDSIAGDAEKECSADNLWEQYRSKHDSFIVDLFYGQLKSTVSCTVRTRTKVSNIAQRANSCASFLFFF